MKRPSGTALVANPRRRHLSKSALCERGAVKMGTLLKNQPISNTLHIYQKTRPPHAPEVLHRWVQLQHGAHLLALDAHAPDLHLEVAATHVLEEAVGAAAH